MIMKLSDEEMDKVDERFWKTIEWERLVFELSKKPVDNKKDNTDR